MKKLIILSAFCYVTNALWIPFTSGRQTVLDGTSAKTLMSPKMMDDDEVEESVPYIRFIKELSQSEVGFSGIHDWKKHDNDDDLFADDDVVSLSLDSTDNENGQKRTPSINL